VPARRILALHTKSTTFRTSQGTSCIAYIREARRAGPPKYVCRVSCHHHRTSHIAFRHIYILTHTHLHSQPSSCTHTRPLTSSSLPTARASHTRPLHPRRRTRRHRQGTPPPSLVRRPLRALRLARRYLQLGSAARRSLSTGPFLYFLSCSFFLLFHHNRLRMSATRAWAPSPQPRSSAVGPPTSASAVLSAAHPGRHGDLSSMPSLLPSARYVPTPPLRHLHSHSCLLALIARVSSSKHTRVPPPSAAIDCPTLHPRRRTRCHRPRTPPHLSFTADSELYDWQDDIYSRAPQLGGASSSPFGFVHKAHVGADVAGNFGGRQYSPYIR
jgi:hypothetical protein